MNYQFEDTQRADLLTLSCSYHNTHCYPEFQTSLSSDACLQNDTESTYDTIHTMLKNIITFTLQKSYLNQNVFINM